jgi:tRNA A37 threonylcarbamoyladenosine modification protein TsaB
VEPLALTVDELIDRVRAQGGSAIFAGEGALRHRDELEASTGGRVAPEHLSIPRASALLWLAREAPELGEVANATAWEPEYVRAAGVERIAAARAAADEA